LALIEEASFNSDEYSESGFPNKNKIESES